MQRGAVFIAVDLSHIIGKIASRGAKRQITKTMFHRFCHEAEYYPTLSRLPLHMRMKLDLIGVKISLKDWLSISFAERTVLCHLPCASDEEKAVLHGLPGFFVAKIPRRAGANDGNHGQRTLGAITRA